MADFNATPQEAYYQDFTAVSGSSSAEEGCPDTNV